jgi:DNA-binding SARP family transcriptional activator/DNA-binding beta-propeller fold protein YncE
VPDDPVDFRLLGPIEAVSGGKALVLGPTKQRALLAVLLLRANHVVSRDELLDALWDEQPPETAGTALHGYVSGLRKALGADRIETRSPGYVIHTAPGEIDVERLESMLADARALDVESRSKRLRDALALWRGQPLADLDPARFVELERRRLDELRIAALEDRIDADLSLGRHAELVSELEALVREHPLRERLRGQLMLALYRSGRQSEALDVYRQGRALLADELGLEPGEALKRLERSILEQDPELGEPPPPPALAPPSWWHGRGRWIAAGLAVLLLASAFVGGLVLTRDDSEPVVVAPNSVAVLDSETGRLVGDVLVGKQPGAVAVGEGAVWVANEGDQTVMRIDPATRTVVSTFGLGTDVSDLAVGFGSVWVADGNAGTLTRIDAGSNAIRETLDLGGGDPLSPRPVFWVSTGGGAVWAIKGDRLLRVDPDTSAVTTSTRIPSAAGLATGAGSVWVVTQDQRLLRVAANGSRTTGELALPDPATAPVVAPDTIWLIVYVGEGEVWGVDPRSMTQTEAGRTGSTPVNLAFGDGELWSVSLAGDVARIDRPTASVLTTTQIGPARGAELAVGGGAVWVTVRSQS